MQGNKIKDAIITIVFLTTLFSVFIINIIVKDKTISDSERRKLVSFPKITKSNIMDGELSEKFEKYFSDQFVGRDFFRSLKTVWSLNIFNQKDNNELFVKDNSLYKMEYKLKEKNVEKSAEKIQEIYNKYLTNMNVYYAIIPEKNYYLKKDDHLKMDYEKIKEIMNKNLRDINYIDIWSSLNLQDYYRTDLHWKQENLYDVVNCLKKDMGLKNTDFSQYNIQDKGNFYGVYYGQLGVNIEPDKLYILTNNELESCVTYNFETNQKGKIYQNPKTADKYDIYLSGAVPLVTVENPNSKSRKELLLFRDSFGSSLAPLLLDSYRKITLIDIRYMSSKNLDQYIDFKEQDVLFLYSSLVLNQNILK